MDSEKQYLQLPVYKGKRNFCEHCKRPFQSGEIVSLNLNGGVLFCYSNGSGPCTAAHYTFSKFRTIRFRDGYLPEKDRTLNGATPTPLSPPLLEWKPEKRSWFSTLWDLFGW